MINTIARPAVLAGWLVLGYLAFVAKADGPLGSATTAAFWLLIGVHAVEALVLASRLRRARAPFLLSDLPLTMIFGVFHVGPRLAPLRTERE